MSVGPDTGKRCQIPSCNNPQWSDCSHCGMFLCLHHNDHHVCFGVRTQSGSPGGVQVDPEKAQSSIHHPSHYNTGNIEVIDAIEDWGFGEGMNRGNAIKYIARAGRKSAETEVEDLKKARWYLDREIARLENSNGAADQKFGYPDPAADPPAAVSGPCPHCFTVISGVPSTHLAKQCPECGMQVLLIAQGKTRAIGGQS